MNPRRVPSSNHVVGLPGGTEDNDLHVRTGVSWPNLAADDPCAGQPYTAAVFEPDPVERAAIATGANVELVILGTRVPPLILGVTREQPLSRPQRVNDGPALWAEFPRELVLDLLAMFQALDTGPQQPVPAAVRQRLRNLAELRRHLEAGLQALDEQAADA